MFKITVLFCFVNVCRLLKITIQTAVQDNYALKTSTFPTSSCLQYSDVRSTYRCLSTCLRTQQPLSIFSYNNLDQRCMCCNDLTGNLLNDPGWTSYTIRIDTCPSGYTFYQATDFTTCLKYVANAVTYPEAVSSCIQDGGDLIRIDSQQKFEIFKNNSEPHAIFTAIEVWVQGEEISGEWRFHDGTLMPNYCPLEESNDPGEIHLRSRSNRDFKCYDSRKSRTFHYMCEI